MTGKQSNNDKGGDDHKRSVTGEMHILGEVSIEPSQKQKDLREAENQKAEKKENREKWTFIFTMLYTVITGFLAYESMQTTKLARESIESVQRAFVTLQTIGVNRIVERTSNGGVAKLQFKAIWENSGATPAIGMIEGFTGKPINREPSEEEFKLTDNGADTLMEATWACPSYNLIRWFSIRRKIAAALAQAA